MNNNNNNNNNSNNNNNNNNNDDNNNNNNNNNIVLFKLREVLQDDRVHLRITGYKIAGGGGTPYIQMIGMIVVFFRGCNQQSGIS